MRRKSPQEKKKLSYVKDRRNAYLANDKASRKSITKRKSEANRSFRKHVTDKLKVLLGSDLEIAEIAEVEVRNVPAPSDFKKTPDRPLGEDVKRKLKARIDHHGKGKTSRKIARRFIEELEIDAKQIEPEKWRAWPKKHPWIEVFAKTEVRAIEKLKHLMEVAQRNETGANIHIQIDGDFFRPTLSK